MNRTLGFEKTIQTGQYEPVKVSTFVSEIPDTLWAKEGFVEELGNLLVVQAYKILINEHVLDKEVRGTGGSKKEILDNVEKQILESLDLQNLIITLNVEITEKK